MTKPSARVGGQCLRRAFIDLRALPLAPLLPCSTITTSSRSLAVGTNKAQLRDSRCLSSLAGFLIVAACVMTFEARDNAAKVVPSTGCSQMEDRKSARKLKVNQPS